MTHSNCYHCGLKGGQNVILFEGKNFCCNGCKSVFEILNSNSLTHYYDFKSTPGISPGALKKNYNYLDNETISEKIIDFKDKTISIVEFYIPTIHCSSCIWVLENLNKLNEEVLSSIVNFQNKKIRITFKNRKTSLKLLVELLASIGYEPYISMEDGDEKLKYTDKTLIYQVAIAAFSFGNIMLLSFPEYFDFNEFWLEKYKYLFRWLIFLMALPVVFYSGKSYFIMAYKGFRNKILNIDVPIALGIAVLFLRSTFEILLDIGPGFFDSLTGLIFFLLIGKFFQKKTYNFLSFERDYKSYFPLAVTRIFEGIEQNISVSEVKAGDLLLIRNEELIPVDGVLLKGNCVIDYSFVSGEKLPVVKESGDQLYAGGKQTSGAIEMEVIKTISQSYLTKLWGHEAFKKIDDITIKNLTDSISKYFTITILSIASLAGIYWYLYDSSMAFNVVTAVLIIACPCALALSAPFALGNMLRIFGYRKLYLKGAEIIESISKIDTIIFDKTGTITNNENSKINYEGTTLSQEELGDVKKILRSSNHPLSRAIYNYINLTPSALKLSSFKEILGQGIEATIDTVKYQIGSAQFVNSNTTVLNETAVCVKIDGIVKGRFIFGNTYREGIKELFVKLSKKYKLMILSGDNEGEKSYLKKILPDKVAYFFNQTPVDKLDFIKNCQSNGDIVLMIGDGLNDAGALAQSNVGIAITEDINVFSPACDAIFDAAKFSKLPDFLALSVQTIYIIKASFVLSFGYNVVGMYFALTGQLTPLVAAILMPLSSITIVVFVTIFTNLISKNADY